MMKHAQLYRMVAGPRRLLLVLMTIGAASFTFAGTVAVTSTNDSGAGSLRQAIAAAQAGDTIVFSLPADSAITLTSGELVIDKGLVISGPGASRLTVRRSAGVGDFRIFNITTGTVTISGLTITNGRLSDANSGAGILNAGTLTVSNTTISNNTAGSAGGAIFNTGTLNLLNATVSGNAANNGGGISGGIVNISNSTISGNQATSGNGGGITVRDVSITNSTISHNSATGSGGAIFNNGFNGATVRARSTIVALNTAATGPDVSGALVSENYNLIGNNAGAMIGAQPADQVGTPAAPLDPLLGALQDNGGSTLTRALLSGSPAIEKGQSGGLKADQRGLDRPVDDPDTANASGGDGSDIGAYEVQAEFLPGCNSIERVVTNTNDMGGGSLRDAIANVCAGSTITFAAGVEGVIRLRSGELSLTRGITINGPGAHLLRISGVDGNRVFRITSANVTISGLTIADGNATAESPSFGGGIYNDHGTVTLRNCAVNNNVASTGGGIYNEGSTSGAARMTIESATFSGNSTSSGGGGGIYNQGVNGGSVVLELTNCTFTGNTTPSGLGAGIYLFGTDGAVTGTLLNCTFAGDNITADRANVGFANSIFQADGTSTFTSFNGTFTSRGHNLSSDTGGGFLTGTGDKPNVDPMLGPLAENGGPTRTMALLSNSSPAVNGGNDALAPPIDQRGYVRVGVSDIGAFEFGGAEPTPTPTPTASPTPTPTPNRFGNIATRLRVETGENVLIGGLIITGTEPKRLIIRAIGPSLPGVSGALVNPQLELYRGPELLAANDNWRDAPNAQEIVDSTVAPNNDLESAVLTTLTPGAYTAVVSGVDGQTGVGSVEAYDLDPAADSTFANISTRGFVQTGGDAMFGGLIITGSSSQKVILRAIGPSLGIAGQLENPTLELFNSEGDPIATNDNWRDTQQAEIEATTIPPSNDLESAIVATLPPAAYTAIVRGVNDTTGVALVEVYALN